MKTYLVEEYNPDIKFEKDSLVIALTPKVCYQLDKEGIKYSIIEDYYDEVELSDYDGQYAKSQLQWIDRLDEFLQKNVIELKELNLKLATIYWYYLKAAVLDPLYVRCYALNRLFEAIKPSTITFISRPPEELLSDFTLRYYGRSYYSQVIPILCSGNNIPLSSVFLESGSKEVREIKSVSRGEHFVTRLKRILAKSGTVRRMYFIYTCSKKLSFTKRARQEKLNIFMLTTEHIREDFVFDALAKGHNVYLLSGDFVTKYSRLGGRRHLNLKAEYEKLARLDSIWRYTANLLDGHDLIKWVNEKCQLDVSQIVLPKLRYFISQVCPEIVAYFKVFTEFYEKDKIDILFTAYVWPPIEYAALAAANKHQHVVTVGLAHGDMVYDTKIGNINELRKFSFYICSHTENREYLRRLSGEINSPVKLYSSPHRLLKVRKISYLREKRGGSIIRKNRIVYLTTFMMGGRGRMDGGCYPDTWYYKFQKSLVKYFSTRGEYTFVWKGLPTADKIYNPIPNFIMDNNFSNVEIATNPLTEHLLSADRVICDYPSTGFYEAVTAGIPTMSLYHKALIVRESAVDYFGNLLRLFSDTSEAIKHIDEFLNSDPELYKRVIDVEGNSILDIFEEISKGN